MLRNPNYQSNSESSQSDISIDDEPISTKQNGFSLQQPLYSDSEEEDQSPDQLQARDEEEDSLDDEPEPSSEEQDDEYDPLPQKNNGIHTVRQEPDENGEEDDDSIDHIEERIKKLERDLENKLGKTKEKETPSVKVGKIIPKAPHPPIPSKVEAKPPQQMSQNKMSLLNEKKNSEKSEPELKKNPVNIIVEKKKKKVQKKQVYREMIPEPKLDLSKKQSMKKSVNSEIQVQNHKQMEEMQKTIDELKHENRRLRDQLEITKSKKKPLEELEKLKDISHKNTKLEKQIELLQVIEKLQSKLKKSIGRKIASNNKSASATLLHKGLPASLLQQL